MNIEARIAKLERSAWRWRLAAGVLSLACVLGADKYDKLKIQPPIATTALLIADEKGITRLCFAPPQPGPSPDTGFAIFGAGTPKDAPILLAVGTQRGDGSMRAWDDQGTLRLFVGMKHGQPKIEMYDAEGQIQWSATGKDH